LHKETHCLLLQKQIDNAEKDSDWFHEELLKALEHLKEAKENWKFYNDEVSQLYKRFQQSVLNTYNTAARYNSARERVNETFIEFRKMKDEYTKQCGEREGN